MKIYCSVLEAETSRSIFWMVQKKFKITTKTVRQFPAILPPSYSLIENLDVNLQYILDPGESNISYAGIFPFNRSFGFRFSMPGDSLVCARIRSALSMSGRSGTCTVSLNSTRTHFRFKGCIRFSTG